MSGSNRRVMRDGGIIAGLRFACGIAEWKERILLRDKSSAILLSRVLMYCACKLHWKCASMKNRHRSMCMIWLSLHDLAFRAATTA